MCVCVLVYDEYKRDVHNARICVDVIEYHRMDIMLVNIISVGYIQIMRRNLRNQILMKEFVHIWQKYC